VSRLTIRITALGSICLSLVFAVTAALFGLVTGFIINLLAIRLAANKPLLGGLGCTRSAHPLRAWQALPVLGYLLQRGRCSQCGRKLSFSYPFTELATGLLFPVLFVLEGWGAPFVFHCAYVAILVLVLVVDLRHRDIYLSVIAVGSLVALAGSFFLPEVGLAGALIGSGVAGGFFLVAYLFARVLFPKIEEPLGLGDVFLALMMGLMRGFPNIVGALVVGPLLAGAAVILLLVLRKRGLGDFIPYGVALCAASIIFVLYPGPFAEALRLPALVTLLSGIIRL
jgi:leader peptidase (prepilin peptidase)/N-methyltransferase